MRNLDMDIYYFLLNAYCFQNGFLRTIWNGFCFVFYCPMICDYYITKVSQVNKYQLACL